MQWFKSLLSADGEVSSKRVVGFGSFLLFAAIAIVHLATGREIQGELIWSIVALITACFGLNALIDVKAYSSKSEVASALATSNTKDPAASKAKDIVEDLPPKGEKEEAVG